MKTDREEQGLGGLVRVVSVETSEIVLEEGDYVEDWLSSPTSNFDLAGNEIEVETRSRKASTPAYLRSAYAYNAMGRIAEIVEYDEAEHTNRTVEHTYDDEGRLTLTTVRDFEGVISKRIVNDYDEQGR